MSETVEVWFNGLKMDAEAYVLNTEGGVNIEFIDVPIVINYKEGNDTQAGDADE